MAGWGMAAGWPGTPEPSIRDGWENLQAGELAFSQEIQAQPWIHTVATVQYTDTGEQRHPTHTNTAVAFSQPTHCTDTAKMYIIMSFHVVKRFFFLKGRFTEKTDLPSAGLPPTWLELGQSDARGPELLLCCSRECVVPGIWTNLLLPQVH